jgi:hypothetical protein
LTLSKQQLATSLGAMGEEEVADISKLQKINDTTRKRKVSFPLITATSLKSASLKQRRREEEKTKKIMQIHTNNDKVGKASK